MHGDFTRLTFSPGKHFSSVLFQQGRVCLDSDANEQAAILLHAMRTLVTDLVGPFGGPMRDCGFRIGVVTAANKPPDLSIGPGRYYVSGLACENDGTALRYFRQPDAHLDPDDADDRLPEVPFVVYLRVSEEHVTAIQDPSLREVALGMDGPDTTTRSRIAWQVLASATTLPGGDTPVTPGLDVGALRDEWATFDAAGGGRVAPLLKARGRHASDADLSPCIASPDASYRGAENQLYRIEVHRVDPDGGRATFKWSRDNGSVTAPILSMTGDEVLVASLGRDSRSSLDVGDWVEVVDDASTGFLRTARLRRILAVDRLDRRVTLEPTNGPTHATGRRSTLHPFLRRWDQRETATPRRTAGAPTLEWGVPIEPGEWQALEDGVEVAFQDVGELRVGDYWLIPARTATGDVEWPGGSENPHARPPVGVVYHYAPLALVDDLNQPPTDLRCAFDTLECKTPPPLNP